MIHIVARLVIGHVAHHVVRHATHHVVNQVAQHATHHVVNQVAQHATHHAVNAVQAAHTTHQTTQSAGTLQHVARAATVLGGVKSSADLYKKVQQQRKEQEKQAIRNHIQSLQQQLSDLEK